MNLVDKYPSDVKITVVKRLSSEELFKDNPPVKTSYMTACSIFSDGQVFNVGSTRSRLIDYKMPEGFCPFAWDALYPWIISLAFRADYSAFYPGNPGVSIVPCSDGMRPVIFKLERM